MLVVGAMVGTYRRAGWTAKDIESLRCRLTAGRGDVAIYWWNGRSNPHEARASAHVSVPRRGAGKRSIFEPTPIVDVSMAPDAKTVAMCNDLINVLESPHSRPKVELGWWGGQVVVPLWIPLLLVAVPTGVLWWRDRRRIPPGHCRQCGYNLTGNISGVCPECGTAVSKEAGALARSVGKSAGG